MVDACSSINTLKNPVIIGSTASYISTIGINSQDCSPASGEICLQLDKAVQEGNLFVVHTKEWIRIRVSSPTNDKIGFFSRRKKSIEVSVGRISILNIRPF